MFKLFAKRPERAYVDIKIHETEPDLDGYTELAGRAIDAYSAVHEPGEHEVGDFSDDARRMAVQSVAREFGCSEKQALEQYEICISPWVSFHGKILVRSRVQ